MGRSALTAAEEHQEEAVARDELRAAQLEQPASPSGQREPTPSGEQDAAEYALGRRERTPAHDAAVDGVGHGGPIAPDPVEDGSPGPTASAAPGPGGDLPPPEHDPAVHFLE